MDKGRIGTDIQDRFLWIWEGALASLPDHRMVRAMEKVKCNLGLWDQALSYWQVRDEAIKWMWSILERTYIRIDVVVTTRPAEFAQALARKCEQENWPIRYVTAESPQKLGRRLSTMPDVKRVFYGLAEQQWAYGPVGYHFGGDVKGQIV